MSFLKVGENHCFTAVAAGVEAGTPATFTITAWVPPSTTGEAPTPRVLSTGDETSTAGAVEHSWTTEGPPTDGDNGQRGWRVSYAVDVSVAVGQETRALHAESQEVEVYHDWVELTTVGEDGSAYPNARFNVVVLQGGREVERRANLSSGPRGVLRLTNLLPGDVRIDFKKPHHLVSWVSGSGCKLKAKVKLVPLARIVWPLLPRGGASHKQWVNLTAAPANKDYGSVCTVTVRLEAGKAGDFVWAKAAYAAAMVSPRNTHKRGIQNPEDPRPTWAGSGSTTTAKKFTVVARGGNFEVDIPIECGLAGLDQISLWVGGTQACDDATLAITSWRKVKFEEIKPAAAISSFAGNGIDAATKRVIESRLRDSGIEPDIVRTATYAAADLQAQESVAGDYVGKSAAQKLVFMVSSRYNSIISAKSTLSASADTQTVAWADAVVSTNQVSGTTDTQRNHRIERGFSSVMPQTVTINAPYAVFPLDWTNTANQSVVGIRWKCSHYLDDDGTWKDVAATTPGAGKMAWQNASVATAADIAKYVEFTNWRLLTFKLPTAAPGDAGNFLTDAGKALWIKVEVKLHLARFATLAFASGGQIAMTTYVGTSTPTGAAEVILHETGHNMGQSVVDRSNAGATQTIGSTGGTANFGRSSAVPGLTFGTPPTQFPGIVQAGYMYTGKGHQGPHCARGLTRTQRGLPNFGGLPGTCIMFGETDIAKRSARHFCFECKALIRGEDLSSYRKTWWA